MDIALRTALENEKKTLEAEYENLETQITALRAESEMVSVRLGHIVALLKGQGTEDGEAQVDSTITAQEESDPLEIAYRILDEKGQDPVHYKELADLVKGRGGTLEGSDPALTLVSRLVTDDRFVRPFRRGYYALRKYYPKSKNVGRRRRRSHRR